MTIHKKGWRYWRNLALFGLGSCLIGMLFIQYVAYPYFASYGHSHPKRLAVCCETPADRGLSYEEIAFTSIDSLTLRGWYIPSKNKGAIILMHGLAANRLMMLDIATILARHDYGVLLFDLRAHGESEGDVMPYGGPEAEDVRGAVTFLQNRPDVDPERIGVMGWSLGAQVGILAAATTSEIKAVVADGPGATGFEDWPPPRTFGEGLYVPFDFVYYQVLPWHTGVREPLSLRKALPQIAPRPILLITGSDLEQHRLEYLFEATRHPKSLWVIPEVGHLGGWNARPQEYEEKIINFFDQAILDAKP